MFTKYVKLHLFENDEGIGWKKGAKGGKNEGDSKGGSMPSTAVKSWKLKPQPDAPDIQKNQVI